MTDDAGYTEFGLSFEVDQFVRVSYAYAAQESIFCMVPLLRTGSDFLKNISSLIQRNRGVLSLFSRHKYNEYWAYVVLYILSVSAIRANRAAYVSNKSRIFALFGMFGETKDETIMSDYYLAFNLSFRDTLIFVLRNELRYTDREMNVIRDTLLRLTLFGAGDCQIEELLRLAYQKRRESFWDFRDSFAQVENDLVNTADTFLGSLFDFSTKHRFYGDISKKVDQYRTLATWEQLRGL